MESEAKTILTKLGISDFGQTVETLSGGQKKDHRKRNAATTRVTAFFLSHL